ncbi:MAG: hypothetical protein GX995_09680 [Clostridiales bacterium]|nr:hypothetical protein [Clostridiales bacterium]
MIRQFRFIRGYLGYHIIASMTSPIRFTAWSDDENATIIPRVDITKK